MSLPSKDPAEEVAIEFDFSSLAPAVSVLSLGVLRHVGKRDANPTAILDGDYQNVNGVVTQNVKGGQGGTTYVVRCLAQLLDAQGADAGTAVLTATLPVVENLGEV